jgi:hypothetical protein
MLSTPPGLATRMRLSTPIAIKQSPPSILLIEDDHPEVNDHLRFFRRGNGKATWANTIA